MNLGKLPMVKVVNQQMFLAGGDDGMRNNYQTVMGRFKTLDQIFGEFDGKNVALFWKGYEAKTPQYGTIIILHYQFLPKEDWDRIHPSYTRGANFFLEPAVFGDQSVNIPEELDVTIATEAAAKAHKARQQGFNAFEGQQVTHSTGLQGTGVKGGQGGSGAGLGSFYNIPNKIDR